VKTAVGSIGLELVRCLKSNEIKQLQHHDVYTLHIWMYE